MRLREPIIGETWGKYKYKFRGELRSRRGGIVINAYYWGQKRGLAEIFDNNL